MGTEHDAINHPDHYTQASVECIQVIEELGLNFHLGNTLKYLWRAGLKGDALEDPRKARWYLDREIMRRTAAARDAHEIGGSVETTLPAVQKP